MFEPLHAAISIINTTITAQDGTRAIDYTTVYVPGVFEILLYQTSILDLPGTPDDTRSFGNGQDIKLEYANADLEESISSLLRKRLHRSPSVVLVTSED